MAKSTIGIEPPISNRDILDFAENNVNLPSDVVKTRRAKVNELRERLQKWMGDNPECGLVKSYLSGSLAKGTALRTSSDIDVALYIKYDGKRQVDQALTDWIAQRLRLAYPQMAADQIQPQEYSVKILYKEANIEIDIVPVFYEDDPDDKGWLVSKRTGRMMMTSIPMHLDFIRKRKAAQPRHFAQAVRLIKWWVAEQKAADVDFRFKSFMVELICAHLLDEGQEFSDCRVGMEAFFNFLLTRRLQETVFFEDYYRAAELPNSCKDPIRIFDPVNPDNNVASQYTTNNRELILIAAQDALDALNEAHMTTSKGHAIEMWQVVLGPTFRG